MSNTTKTLSLLDNAAELQFTEPTLVLNLLNAGKISINQSCGGHGTCTTCRFFVVAGLDSFSERSEIEVERSSERGFAKNERLACQTEIHSNALIEVPDLDFDF